MLTELIVFGGVFFWCVITFLFLAMISFAEKDDYANISIFIASLAFFYAFTKPPGVFFDWRIVGGYFLIGTGWWFTVFNIKLLKIRKHIKEKGAIKNGELIETMIDYEYRLMLRDEPSFEKFFGRTFCWPMSIIKYFFSDVLQYAWDYVSGFFVYYKERILGLK